MGIPRHGAHHRKSCEPPGQESLHARGEYCKCCVTPFHFRDGNFLGLQDVRWLQAGGFSKEEARKKILDARAEHARRTCEEQMDREERGEGGSAEKSLESRTF